eukprot:TRINITY_DN1201_c0_g2_i1.p2 TRINITY_DN1201_c0_g2~~TRINITY_DN1201_c0_g2_i1.p2  ORF type:complete len:277 (+),score=67.29 TRINITY_DN1201_c0_g2_i1:29-832(+)
MTVTSLAYGDAEALRSPTSASRRRTPQQQQQRDPAPRWADEMDEVDAAAESEGVTITVHDPYVNQPEAPPAAFAVNPTSPAEQVILDVVSDLLDDEGFNPGHGSVAVEKVLHAVGHRCPSVLRLVLRNRTFHTFIVSHPEMFHIFAVGPIKWRLRSVHHAHWEAADARNRSQRRATNAVVEAAWVAFLRYQPGFCATVNDFIAAYPTLPYHHRFGGERVLELPRRGDLVRLVRYRSHIFDFDNVSHVVTLLPQRSGPPAIPSLSRNC